MTEFLVRHFVKDSENTESVAVRTAYGLLSGGVGIILNIILFVVKLLIGFFSNSVSVMADAFNNLSDAASSIISFIGARMAGKPADEEHPFGHGRIEYISAFIVAFMVLLVGVSLLKSSISKIFEPEEMSFSSISVIILLISVTGKLWLSAFNTKLGKKIDSKVMLATAADARGDVLATAATILSLVLYRAFSLNCDGVIGVIVSMFVLKAGYEIAVDTLQPIIGQATDPEMYKRISDFVERYDGVIGAHDLIVNNYGPSNSIASIHVELPNTMSLDDAHYLLDGIEGDAKRELGILLVTHADPVNLNDKDTNAVRDIVESVVKSEEDPRISFHDLRLVHGFGGTNAVFDLVTPWDYKEDKVRAITESIKKKVKEKNERLNCIITVEHSYGA